MGILEFLTGHNEKEADVYANYDKVDLVVEKLDQVAKVNVENAKSMILSAVQEFNNVNGVSTYMQTIDGSYLETQLDSISSIVNSISVALKDKADSIKAYSESSTGDKILSTTAMVASKIGEGFLSVFENIGDGVISAIGWLAPKDSGLEKACESFVKKNLAHDVFNFYYESEFAKKSAITEQSALATVAKFGGQMVGFTTLGIGLSKAGKALGGSSSTSAKVFNTFAGTTKRTAMSEAGFMGMGLGTESALKSGKDMNSAALSGFKTAAISTAIAWGVSTLFEKYAANKAAKTETKAREVFASEGDDVLRVAGDRIDDALPSPNTSQSGPTYQQKLAREYVDDLQGMLDKRVSAEQYFELKGETIVRSGTRAEAGAVFGDPNAEMYSIIDRVGASSGIKQKYLNQVDNYIFDVSSKPASQINMSAAELKIKSIFKSAGLDSSQQQHLWDLYKYKIKVTPTTDSAGLFSSLQSHMTEEESARISSMLSSGNGYSSQLLSTTTQAQREAAYVYTKNGYEEMNSILTGDVKGYYAYHYGSHGMSQQEMLDSVYSTALGNSQNAANGQVELANLVRNNRVGDNIVVHRAIGDFGGLTKVKQLTAGTSFTNEGFTSATASVEDFANILQERSGNIIRLDIIVPKGSEAAYIEPLSGIPGYFQNEVLINPNSKLTIIENAFQEKVGKRLVTVVKCILT